MYRGVGADFEKPKKYFRLIMNGYHKTGRKVDSRKTLKKIDLENFKPLYTNKKVQLQLDFLISAAVAGLFLLVIKRPATAGLFD